MPEYELAFLDTETSGLDPWQHRVVEVAVEKFTPWPAMVSEGRLEFKVKLSPEDFSKASPKALEVNGYTEEKWADAFEHGDPSPWVILHDFLRFAVIVGQNVPFDTGFIEAEFGRRNCLFEGRVPWQRRLIDVQSYCHILATEYDVQQNGKFSWGLSPVYAALVEREGAPPLVEHRAGPDIDKAVHIYRLARERFERGKQTHSVLISPFSAISTLPVKIAKELKEAAKLERLVGQFCEFCSMLHHTFVADREDPHYCSDCHNSKDSPFHGPLCTEPFRE